LWFAQTLALRFQLPDFWAILTDWPPSLFEFWRARYLVEPWDMDNKLALAKVKYKPPQFGPPKRRRLDGTEF